MNACLRSVLSSGIQIDYNIFILDNASTDGSVDLIQKEYPNVILLKNPKNVGYAKGNNIAIQKSSSDFILLLNPDTIVLNNSIQKMIDFINTNKSIGILGCRVIKPNGDLQWDSCGTYLTPLMFFIKESGLEKMIPSNRVLGSRLLTHWRRNSTRDVDWVSGACMLIRREVVESIGLLDDRFFSYMEDVDYCHRAHKKRWGIRFLHTAEIIHDSGASWKQRSDIHLLTSLISDKLYLHKYYGLSGAFYFKITYFIGCFFRLFFNILLKNRNRARDHYRTIIWAFTGRI
ncbi:MAG: hypothetical protein A2V66_15620 [Ignavibacteria bacterium RBG_13_36_8]|nr:MAG: hypothetical protein A2V66_15620 [Ignavibacteria bacterium RBG_13_36_8]